MSRRKRFLRAKRQRRNGLLAGLRCFGTFQTPLIWIKNDKIFIESEMSDNSWDSDEEENFILDDNDIFDIDNIFIDDGKHAFSNTDDIKAPSGSLSLSWNESADSKLPRGVGKSVRTQLRHDQKQAELQAAARQCQTIEDFFKAVPVLVSTEAF